jgi:hypothetical protein
LVVSSARSVQRPLCAIGEVKPQASGDFMGLTRAASCRHRQD